MRTIFAWLGLAASSCWCGCGPDHPKPTGIAATVPAPAPAATFSVTANGTMPVAYQWSVNGTNINSVMTLTNVQVLTNH